MDIYKIKIGDEITLATGYALCKHFGFDTLASRIETFPEKYKTFIFDGASCLDDRPVAVFFGMNPEDFTYKAALPHDLGYAYGKLGDDEEKKAVDKAFEQNLIYKCGMNRFCSFIFYLAVKVGGIQILNQSFSWGFADTKRFHF